MSTYTQILYHISYSTKNRKPTLLKENRPLLYRNIKNILRKKGCQLYEINGTDDHLHILTHLHPSVSPASLVKTIKLSTTSDIKDKFLFPAFNGWQDGYVAFTHSIRAKEELVRFIRDQEKFHQSTSYLDELINLLKQHQIDFNEHYLL